MALKEKATNGVCAHIHCATQQQQQRENRIKASKRMREKRRYTRGSEKRHLLKILLNFFVFSFLCAHFSRTSVRQRVVDEAFDDKLARAQEEAQNERNDDDDDDDEDDEDDDEDADDEERGRGSCQGSRATRWEERRERTWKEPRRCQ